MIDPGHPALKRVRALCLALPDSSERLSHGTPSWYVREKRQFVTLFDNHHDDGRLAIWCAATLGVQQTMVDADPERFFRPPYVGHLGWLGVRLDRDLKWDEVARFIRDAHATVLEKLGPGRRVARVAKPSAPSAPSQKKPARRLR